MRVWEGYAAPPRGQRFIFLCLWKSPDQISDPLFVLVCIKPILLVRDVSLVLPGCAFVEETVSQLVHPSTRSSVIRFSQTLCQHSRKHAKPKQSYSFSGSQSSMFSWAEKREPRTLLDKPCRHLWSSWSCFCMMVRAFDVGGLGLILPIFDRSLRWVICLPLWLHCVD